MCHAEAGTVAAATISATAHHGSAERRSRATNHQIAGMTVIHATMLLASNNQTCAGVTNMCAAAKSLIERSTRLSEPVPRAAVITSACAASSTSVAITSPANGAGDLPSLESAAASSSSTSGLVPTSPRRWESVR